MKYIQYLLLILFLVLFLYCKNSDEKINIENKFIHEWQSKKTVIPGKSFIKIYPNYTFEYKSAGCQWRTNSFGNWKVINDTLILNSIPSKECQILDGFGEIVLPLKKGEVYKPKTTLKGCQPEQWENVYVEFVNEKFYIKSDTLEYVTNIKMPFNDRIAFFIKQ